MKSTLVEPACEIPIIDRSDVCILGGSCTGVFAAVTAARLGLTVTLVEMQGCFGGVGTSSMVNVWHSLLDTEFRKPIIAGLTSEVCRRLEKRAAIQAFERSESFGFIFNSEELKIELDELVSEHRIKFHLHTQFSRPYLQDGQLRGVIIENKNGRSAILAERFIDATGDADLCARLPGVECFYANHLQPATTCARIEGWKTLLPEPFDSGINAHIRKFDLGVLVRQKGAEFNIPQGMIWGCYTPNSDVYMLAGTRIYGVNPANAEQLTRAEVEGRRQVRAIMDLIRKYHPEAKISLQALPGKIGLRESRHVRCLHRLTGEEVLWGKRFDDAIANGSYRVDVHHQEKAGVTLRYLDGSEEIAIPGQPRTKGRWRPVTSENPTYYQIPLRSMIPDGPYDNVIVAGRMIDADPQAHAAIRVMVNMNQTGEAAAVACYLSLRKNLPISRVEGSEVRTVLKERGSAFPE